MSNALKTIAMLFPPIRKIQEDREALRQENARLLDSKGVMLNEMTRALTVEKSAIKGEKDANGDLAVLREELDTVKAQLTGEVESLKTALDEKTHEFNVLEAKAHQLEVSVKSLTSELYIKQIQVEERAFRAAHAKSPARAKSTRAKAPSSRAKAASPKTATSKRGPKKKPAKRSSSKASVKA